MKAFILRIAAAISLFICGISSVAAQDMVAILIHEGTPTVFKGKTALQKAVTAANPGDAISLSQGSFNGVTIDKPLTIVGSGIGYDDTPSTTIGSTTISVADADAEVKIEALKSTSTLTLSTPALVTLQNCDLGTITTSGDFTFDLAANGCKISTLSVNGARLSNCIISGNASNYSNGYAINCTFIAYPGKDMTFFNCIITTINDPASYSNVIEISSDIYTSWGASNCIFLQKSIQEWVLNNNRNCQAISGFKAGAYGYSDVDYSMYTDKTWYALTDEYASQWLGSDGTQVGAYGGANPFNPISSLPRIVDFNVDEKTTPDGVLNVQFNVE